MASDKFYIDFMSYIKANDGKGAMNVLMSELGNILVTKREDFLYVMKYSGVNVPVDATDLDLVNLFLNNVNKNRKLLLGTSFLISHNNKMTGFDGEQYTSNICADAIHKTMHKYFDGDKMNSYFDGMYDGEKMSYFDGDMDGMAVDGENFSNLGADEDSDVPIKTSGGGAAAIANAVSGLSKLGQQIAGNSAKGMLAKKQDAKAALLQSVIAQKKAQLKLESDKAADAAKTKKIKIIAVSSVIGLVLIVGGVIAYKKFGKK